MKKLNNKDPARIQYLIEQILEVCRDMQSARFYARVARALPDDVIFQWLAEIKQDEGIRNRGAARKPKTSVAAGIAIRRWYSMAASGSVKIKPTPSREALREGTESSGIFKRGEPIVDPVTGDVIGYELEEQGSPNLKEVLAKF